MRVNRPAMLALIFLLVTALPVRCEDGGNEDWWSDPLEALGNWFYENLYKPVSDAVQGAEEWLYENVYDPASEWWYWNIQRPMEDWSDAVGNTVSEAWNWLTDTISNAGEAVSNTVENAGKTISETVSNAINDVGEAISEAVSDIPETVSNTIQEAGEAVSNVVSEVVETVSDAVQEAGEWLYENVYEPVSDWLTDATSGAEETPEATETTSNTIQEAGEAISNVAETVSDAVQGAGEWLYENVYEPASEWWRQNIQEPIEYWWSDETWDQIVGNADRYFSGSAEDVIAVEEESHPTGETGLDGVNDIWDVDFPTLWLGWDITFPWGQKWTVGIDLMAPFESTFNKGAEVAFEVFFKKPVGLMWSLWSGTYKICRGLGLAAPFAVTAAAGVEISVGAVLVMIIQKVIDVIL